MQPNGVNLGETLGVLFDLVAGKTFTDIIDSLALGLTSPNPGTGTTVRIGIKVQGFDGDGSESFVNNGIIPEPSSMIVWAIAGCTGAIWIRRRRQSVPS